MNNVITQLPDLEEFYYFGAAGFNVESKSSFSEAQLGCRAHPDGSDLTGNNKGDWLPSWYAIGIDTLVGDPYFVDSSLESFPTYIARYDQGSWHQELVSKTLSGFIESIKYLKEVSKQDEGSMHPDENTISDDGELETIYKHLLSLCGEDSSLFWKSFIAQHQDWINESEDQNG